MLVAFDIETGPMQDLDKALQIKPFSPGRLKDPEKIEAKKLEHASKFALHPTVGEVLTVGYGTQTGNLIETRCDYTEQELIVRFWDFFENSIAAGKHILCGWCIYPFDLPFLITRSRILNIDVHPKLLRDRHWHHRVKDLERIWSCHAYGKMTSLDEACLSMGWPSKPASGKDFADHFTNDFDLAMEYCEHDMTQTYRMAKHLLGEG